MLPFLLLSPFFGSHWTIATGDHLGTTDGAMMFMKSGNAADAAVAA